MTTDSKINSVKLGFIKIAALAGVVLLFVVVFMEIKAGRELDLAREFVPRSAETAIRHYFQALNWYAPWGSSQTAADELLELATKYQKEGQKELAYEAFLRLRGAIHAARSFYTPRRDILAVANVFLANNLADKKLSFTDQKVNREELYSYYLGIYSAEVNFSEFFALIVVISFFGWIYFFIKFLFSFFGDKELWPIKRKIVNSKIIIGLFLACYLAWILSMKAA
jgi:hypothetical protein